MKTFIACSTLKTHLSAPTMPQPPLPPLPCTTTSASNQFSIKIHQDLSSKPILNQHIHYFFLPSFFPNHQQKNETKPACCNSVFILIFKAACLYPCTHHFRVIQDQHRQALLTLLLEVLDLMATNPTNVICLSTIPGVAHKNENT
jgi:hypothetical protein